MSTNKSLQITLNLDYCIYTILEQVCTINTVHRNNAVSIMVKSLS